MPTKKPWDYVIETKKGKSVPIVKRRERGGAWIHFRTIEEGVY